MKRNEINQVVQKGQEVYRQACSNGHFQKAVQIETNLQTQHLAPIIPLLLPNLHLLHHHLARILPRGQPVIPRIPELLPGRGRSIHPRLARLAILEPAVGAADGDVEDEVEVLVEGGGEVARLRPRVHEAGAVGVREREVAAFPERGVELGVEDLEQPGVDVGEEVFLAPFQPERVRFLREGGVQRVALHIRPPPGVVGRVGAPVQGARHDVVAALGVGVVVATRLGDVDFAGLRPWAVLGFDG